MKKLVVLLAVMAAGARAVPTEAQTAPATGTKRALLIGINTYQPAGTMAQHKSGCVKGGRCDLEKYPDLHGPLNDVAMMRDLLRTRFDFDAKNITVLTDPGLPDSQMGYATLDPSQTDHEGIMAAMEKYLVTVPQKGDTVVFFYAGHGSLRVNSKGTKLPFRTPEGVETHVDSTLVPSDAWTGKHDIRDREMTQIFNAALDKGIHLTVLLDSCHSGSFTRGVELGPKVTERDLAYDPADVADATEPAKPTERKENPALVFSAAQQDQSAGEGDFGDEKHPETHGFFTLALVKALEELPTDAPADVVFRQVRAVMADERQGVQTPVLDASEARRKEPLFGGGTGAGGVRAAVVAADDEGNVQLDAGKLAGFAKGSEFVRKTKDAHGRPVEVRLRVEDLDGITHSEATVVSPHGAKVEVGQVFTLDKWIPGPLHTLNFWNWQPNLALADIEAALAAVRQAGITPVDDPVEKHWTDMLAWNGMAWELRHAGNEKKHEAATTTVLARQLTVAMLKASLPADAAVWVNVPPPQEVFAKLRMTDETSLVQSTIDPGKADYVLVGSVANGQPQWAWFHKMEYDAGPREKETHDHSPGCSTTSRYPVSSDWVPLSDKGGADDTAAALQEYALTLAKVNGWLNLVQDQDRSLTGDFYHLVVRRATDQSAVAEDTAVKQGDRLHLGLAIGGDVPLRVEDARWVYVLDIDCHGNGTLLYPQGPGENQFPKATDMPHAFDLPGAPTLRVGPPYGVDTVLFLTTEQPLPDPFALNFKGVSSRGTRGVQMPLERLLSGASAGTRGLIPGEVPTQWSVVPFELHSVPADSK